MNIIQFVRQEVLLVGWALRALGAWAWFGWPSFLCLVARPARARWRYLTVYRRNWQPVMVMSGLVDERIDQASAF